MKKKIIIAVSMIIIICIGLVTWRNVSNNKIITIGEILNKSFDIGNINKIRIDYDYYDKFYDHGIKDRNELNNIISQVYSITVRRSNLDQYTQLDESYYTIAISTNENGYCKTIRIYDTNYIVIDDLKTHKSKTYIILNQNIEKSYLYELLKKYRND